MKKSEKMVDKNTWVFLLQNINHKLNGQIGIVDYYGFIIG